MTTGLPQFGVATLLAHSPNQRAFHCIMWSILGACKGLINVKLDDFCYAK